MVYLGMPVFSSKPHCLDCDPEYFKNVSGFQPNRKKHDSWVGIEPVSNPIQKLLACNNLVYYKEVATSLKTPWIYKVFHLVTRL